MFRSIAILLLLTALAMQVQPQTITMEEGLLRFFEQFRCRMIYEQDNINIPKLDPYEEEEMNFEFEDPSMGSMAMLLKNLRVEGLSTFHVPDLQFDMWTLNFWLYIAVPKLKVSGWYSLSGEMQDMLELRGSGDFDMEIDGLLMYMDGQQGHEGINNTWWLNRLSVDVKIDKLTGHMNGIMDDEVLEDFFNYLMNNAAPQLLEAVFPDIEPQIVEQAKEMVPEMLNGTPLLDVVEIIFLQKEFFMELPEDECPIPPITRK